MKIGECSPLPTQKISYPRAPFDDYLSFQNVRAPPSKFILGMNVDNLNCGRNTGRYVYKSTHTIPSPGPCVLYFNFGIFMANIGPQRCHRSFIDVRLSIMPTYRTNPIKHIEHWIDHGIEPNRSF